MELPHPPKDTDLRNIIDKLAQFVARNGPEFEQMTKSKQKNNPKFSFLYGGDHFNYYQYKVTTEQAILKQSSGRRDVVFPAASPQYGMPPAPGPTLPSPGSDTAPTIQPNLSQWLTRQLLPDPPPGMSPAAFTATAIDAIVTQQSAFQEQIKQSEANLNAQHAVLIQQQQTQMEETVATAQSEMIQRLAAESNITLSEFDGILQPIIDSCTKDSISTGKGWILSHAMTHESGLLIAQYLLKKVITPGAAFTHKLHIIYLVNDVLHHCARKNADDLKKSLESVVVPMFCNATIAITEEQENKLNKLLKLWESKSNYFDQSVIEKMKDPTNSYQEYTASLISQYAHLITPLTQQTKTTFENYQKQHQAFVTHTLQQIQQLEMQKQMMEQQQQQMNMSQMPPPEQNNIPPPNQMQQQFGPVTPFTDPMFNQPPNQMPPYDQPSFCNNNQPLFPQGGNEPPQIPSYGSTNGTDVVRYDFDPTYGANNNTTSSTNNGEEVSHINLSQPPPGFFEGSLPPSFQNGLPDLSKPPPGFASATTPEICADDLLPSVPYFELPAGLMVPLIMLEDSEYKSLDPDSIKLPPPAPPSDRLLAAVKAFYAAPNHTTPQDRAKNSARKQKEEDIKGGSRQKSRSPSPIQLDHFLIRSAPMRRYRSKSRSQSRERERSRSKSPSYRVRSQSPEREHPASRRGNRRGRRNSPQPSPSRSPGRPYNRRGSPEPDVHGGADEHHLSRNDRPLNRSPVPPGAPDEREGIINELDSTNKGHQMLRKMGWTQGAGLGATGQGITAPVSANPARDKDQNQDINMSDPYENFRKNKGAAFITRMKERALERSS
ncbi:SR-related CTD associated factor 6 isoform X2 [Arctopsyche grandis]|uniref:SR-related CTD associated factor 6 isoform X2 n=1 Tax=Arctopsyche grandis TaxID=121162 RepID=UPI00406D8ABD